MTTTIYIYFLSYLWYTSNTEPYRLRRSIFENWKPLLQNKSSVRSLEVEANIYLINIDGHIYIVINNLIIKQMEERELLSLNLPLRSYTKLLLNNSDYFSNLLYKMTKTTTMSTFWKRSEWKAGCFEYSWWSNTCEFESHLFRCSILE